LKIFENFALCLRQKNREADEELLLEVMDALAGSSRNLLSRSCRIIRGDRRLNRHCSDSLHLFGCLNRQDIFIAQIFAGCRPDVELAQSKYFGGRMRKAIARLALLLIT